MPLLEKIRIFMKSRPVVRGVLAYGALWPTGCLIQQTLEGHTFENYDWKRAIRFGLYGGLFIAPTLYGYIRVTTFMWPTQNFKSAVTKAFVDQISYTPIATICFFFVMSLLEGKKCFEAVDEVELKFLPTFEVGLCYWPILQSINYGLIPERNRVLFASICSLVWTVFLAYMKFLEKEKLKNYKETKN